jgi:hypothetical protein
MNKYLGNYQPVKTEIPTSFKDFNDFNRIGVELFKEITIPVRIISSARRADPITNELIEYSKEVAVVIGSLIRFGKLSDSLLEQFVKARQENAIIFFRCLAETYINLKFFLKHSDNYTLQHYIKHSLQAERQVLEVIKKNTTKNKNTTHLEQRIIDSMNRAFDTADFEFDELNKSSKWKSKVKQRLSEIINPDAYALIYGLGSHSIHGNWQDLVMFHLKKGENGFLPNAEWTMPQIQILTAATFFSCDILIDYIEKLCPVDDEQQKMIELIKDIESRARKLDELHEEHIQQKNK